MTKKDVLCGVWAWETKKSDGTSHHCHAELYRLSGHTYPKNIIKNVLKEKGVLSKESEWVLIACKPYHDGSSCESYTYELQSRLWKDVERAYPRHDRMREFRDIPYQTVNYKPTEYIK